MNNSDNVLEVKDLSVEFDTYGGVIKAVRGVSYEVPRGKTLAIVGESGCGKSVTVQSIMGLIPKPPGRVTSGSALIDGVDLLNIPEKEARKYRGADIGMIFQDAMSALNPTMKIGKQIAEMLVLHKGLSMEAGLKEAVRLLDLTRIPEAHRRVQQYPFEFSGGMLQRVMIAMSVACKPKILIADEPTTALDVTIQDQVLELMRDLQREEGMSIILITHDLGVVARMADTVAVMYAGQVVETGSVDDVFYRSSHPYTLGLKQAMPSSDRDAPHVLKPIAGSPPDLFSPPEGCAYAVRCPVAKNICSQKAVPLFEVETAHYSSCWLQHPKAPFDQASGLHRRSGGDK